MNNIICPNINSEAWQRLLKKHNNNPKEAFQEWEANGYDFPSDIYDDQAKDEIMEESIEEDSTDKYLKSKERLLNNARSSLQHKLKTLSFSIKKNPHLGPIREEMEKLLNQMNKLDTDFALVKFVQGAERMVNSSIIWMDKIKDNPNYLNDNKTINNLKRVHDSVASFSLLRELQEEFFEDPEHKEELKKISEILRKQDTIKNSYIILSREILTNRLSKNFTKVQEFYKEKAERQFNSKRKIELKQRGIKGSEMEIEKRNYISNFMIAHKDSIEVETKDYIEKMLVQTADISTLIRFVENPKDMNHDIISIATQYLDQTDKDIRDATIERTYGLDSLYNDFIEQVGKQGDPKTQFEILLAKDKNGNILPELVNINSNNWKVFDSTHKNDAVRRLYDFLKNMADEKSAMVRRKQDLGYKLPNINKTFLERAYSSGAFATIKDGFMDHFKFTSKDTDFGNIDSKIEKDNTVEVSANEQGKEREEVPLYYRATIPESDLSYDIISSFLIDYNNSLNYQSKTESGLFLETLKDIVNEASIEQRETGSKKLKIDKLTGLALTKDKQNSNIANIIESLIRHRVYGINVEGDPKTAKVLSELKKVTSFISLGGNILSGAANLLQGHAVTIVEAVGSKKSRYSSSDRIAASLKLNKDLPNITMDIGERVYKSKTNQLLQYFNVMSDYTALDKRFIDNNRLKRIMEPGVLMFANSVAEYSVQATMMYSRFNNIKMIGKDGNYLTKEYVSTKNRSEAISLDEAITFNDKGMPIFDKRINRTEITNGVSSEDMNKIEGDVRRINRDLFGNYDQANKSELQRNAFGSLLTQMRQWIITGLQKRYRGIGNVKTKTADLDLEQRSYNPYISEFEEGMYTSAIKFFWNAKKEFATLKVATIAENWNQLTDNERANIKMTIIEWGLAFAFWGLALGLKGDDDDDKDNLLAAYLSRRLYSELISFTNPNEALRTFRSPMMTTNTLESVIDLMTQGISDPTAVYETGRHVGEYKIKRKFTKLFPVWKQFDRSLEESMLFLER